ncbi:MAG: phosphatidylglycerol lysyltransferase domain-containing protein [Desulfosporosinus sp.]
MHYAGDICWNTQENQIKLGSWNFNAIRLGDIDLYQDFIQNSEHPTTLWSSNFAYLWSISQSRFKTLLWRITDDMLVTFVHTNNNCLYLMCLPYGKGTPEKVVNVVYQCMKYCAQWNAPNSCETKLRMINDSQRFFLEQKPSFNQLFEFSRPLGYECHYGVQNLLNLQGQEFQRVRGRVNKFKKDYPQTRVGNYLPSDYNDLMLLNDEWEKTTGQKYKHIFDTVYYPEILKHHDQLQQLVLLVEIDSRIVGMISGGVLPNGQSWACLCKALIEFDGLSEFLVIELVRAIHSINPAVETMNDGGNLTKGLKAFKEKFRPVLSLRRYRVLLK